MATPNDERVAQADAFREYDERWAFHMDALAYGLRQVQVTDELGGVLALLAESVKMLQFDVRRIALTMVEATPPGSKGAPAPSHEETR